MSDQESWPVKVYIYDNSKGMVKPLSRTLLGKLKLGYSPYIHNILTESFEISDVPLPALQASR